MVMITIDLPDDINRLIEIEKAKRGDNDKRITIIELLKKVVK